MLCISAKLRRRHRIPGSDAVESAATFQSRSA
jgi:hypothetical protein